MGKPKRKFTDAQKRAAVDDYVSGRKSAAQVAAANEISTAQVYSWRVQLEEKDKGAHLDELQAAGRSREDALLIAQLEAERDAYQGSSQWASHSFCFSMDSNFRPLRAVPCVCWIAFSTVPLRSGSLTRHGWPTTP